MAEQFTKISITALIIFLLSMGFCRANNDSWFPLGFEVPESASFKTFQLLKVNPEYAEADWKALMSAREAIREALNSTWPEDSLTVAANKRSLQADRERFEAKQSFTFHIVGPKKAGKAQPQIFGCLYILPPTRPDQSATVYFWLRQDEKLAIEASKIQKLIGEWLDKDWPFNGFEHLQGAESEV